MAEAAKALPQFFQAMQAAPSAPVVMRALGRFVANLVIEEAKAVGPSPALVAQMEKSLGYDSVNARALYDAVITDAIGRTVLKEPPHAG